MNNFHSQTFTNNLPPLDPITLGKQAFAGDYHNERKNSENPVQWMNSLTMRIILFHTPPINSSHPTHSPINPTHSTPPSNPQFHFTPYSAVLHTLALQKTLR